MFSSAFARPHSIHIPDQHLAVLFVHADGELIPPEDPRYNQFFSFIAHDEYLSAHSGQTAERNGARTPWVHQLDLRVAQTIPVAGDQHLEIHAELVNLLNLLNASWGLVQSVPYQRVPVPDGEGSAWREGSRVLVSADFIQVRDQTRLRGRKGQGVS